jgi:hypothetical protein
MKLVHGIWKDGCVILDEKADWPEGTRVAIAPVDRNSALTGLKEEDSPPDHAEIEARLALMDRIEPLEMSAEEEAEFAAWRQQVKEYTVAGATRRIDGLFP